MREWVQFSCTSQDEIESYRQVLTAAYEYVRSISDA